MRPVLENNSKLENRHLSPHENVLLVLPEENTLLVHLAYLSLPHHWLIAAMQCSHKTVNYTQWYRGKTLSDTA